MQFMPKGSLRSVLKGKTELPWPLRIKIATDIAKGLAFLHNEKILHLDLKSLNVLLDDNFNGKICDFGLATLKQETRSNQRSKSSMPGASSHMAAGGTLPWMAPELFGKKPKSTFKTDIYSFGMTLWELYSRTTPFAQVKNDSLIISMVEKGEREDFDVEGEDCPEDFKEIIQDCWKADPINRPSADEIIKRLNEISYGDVANINIKKLEKKPLEEEVKKEDQGKNNEEAQRFYLFFTTKIY